MNKSLTRYTDDMLISLSGQSLPALVFNAVGRGLLFTAIMQLLSYASVGQASTLAAMAVLTIVFIFIIFSIDLIEKYAAREVLRRRG